MSHWKLICLIVGGFYQVLDLIAKGKEVKEEVS
jgi:hypothetical protein